MIHTADAPAADATAPTIGGHPALDLLNTQARSQDELVDHWTSDENVLRWLERQGLAPALDGRTRKAPARLLGQARELRSIALELIMRRKEGKAVATDGLNRYLHAHLTAPHLQADGQGGFVLARMPRGDTPAALLGPLAEAVAQLLAEGNFELVRKCEHPDCVLWFYDRTKSRRRRWCSMALCGNRHKAARFRERRGAPRA